MDVDEAELVGSPLDQVPEQDPTAESCMGRRWERDDGEKVFLGYCGAWPGKGTDHVGEGRCSKHGGSAGAPEGNSNAEGNDGGAPEGNSNAEGNDGGGAPEGNDNAVEHGAYAEHALNSLTEAERAAFDEVATKLDDPENAQEIARRAASYCLMMGHRAGDDRWFRRFEGICDKFELAPEEVQKHEHEHDGSLTVDHEHALDEKTERRIGKLFDGMSDE